jgi:hypothetical protein
MKRIVTLICMIFIAAYATSKSPLGPYVKAANNSVLQKNTEKGGTVTGTGHNNIVYSPDGKEMFYVYHGRITSTGDQRLVFIDRTKILKDGTLVVEGPFTIIQQNVARHHLFLKIYANVDLV